MGIIDNPFFSEIRGNLGFGCMRLPTKKGTVDMVLMQRMVDLFLENGFNYFDTAHGYLRGMSEIAIREAVTKRYPRERYILANKLSGQYIHGESDIRPFFEKQLEICGVDYFDFYLMHAQDSIMFETFRRYNAYETALELKREGKIRHFGISFHDKAEVLMDILTKYPQIEIVQIQFNYLDYEDIVIESRKVYEICEYCHKPVLVMEPIKGGNLAKLPKDAQRIFDELQERDGRGKSNASYALRFAADFPNICVVLSGMNSIEQMQENVSLMKNFEPLSESEKLAIEKVCSIFQSMNLIPCTACGYCIDGCPQKILIPELFSCMNAKRQFHNWNQDYYYRNVLTQRNGTASECIHCGRCETICPQHLEIRKLLEEVAAEFERRPKKK